MHRIPIFLAMLLALANPVSAGEPRVTITYSETFDSLCSMVIGSKIAGQWKQELIERKPEFDALWEENGPALIAATEAITGKTFRDDEVTIRLTLCDLPSQSWLGISINMRFALNSFPGTTVPMRYKVHTAFHELLHDFLSEREIRDSALLAQHANQPERVQDHLHLLALQKAVLLRLGEEAVLQEIISIDSQLPNGYYKLAWQIVNSTDTSYMQYVEEITK